MTKDEVCAGVDVTKNTPDVAVTDSEETLQFPNDHEGITNAVRYIAGLKPAGICMVGVAGFEPAASWSQTMRANHCATPR